MIHGFYSIGGGFIYISGQFNGAGFVTKLDTTGSVVWERRYSGSGSNACGSMASDSLGNIYVGGRFNGTAVFDSNPSNRRELTSVHAGQENFICKIDSQGNLMWAEQLGGLVDLTVWAPGVSLSTDGSIFFSDTFDGTVDLDPSPSTTTIFTTPARLTPYIVKLTPTGNLIWARQFEGGNGSHNYNLGAVADPRGGVFVSGRYGGTIDLDPGIGSSVRENRTSLSSGFMVKLDSSGNFVWGSTVSSPTGHNWVREISPDGTSGLIAVGVFSGTARFESPFGSFDLISKGDRDGFVARLQFPADTTNPVTVRVEDGRGGFDEQSFVINVSVDNHSPILALVADKTVRAGETLHFQLGNPGLRSGELLAGRGGSSQSQILRVDPVSGISSILFSTNRQPIGSGDHLFPNFLPNSLILDTEGFIWTHSPLSGIDLSVSTGVRLNPADLSYSEDSFSHAPRFFRVFAQLANGNYLVQTSSNSILSEFNLVTGPIRIVSDRFEIATPGNGGVVLAHSPDGRPFIDEGSNVFISGAAVFIE